MKQEKQTNSLANNSTSRVRKVANVFSEGIIRELEISVNSQCNLNCIGCGFNVPNQLSPYNKSGVDEHISALVNLKKCGIKINKIVIAGGEATLFKDLKSTIIKISSLNISNEIELVTNGLYPKGVPSDLLNVLDSIVISDYIKTNAFESAWIDFLQGHNFKGNVDFRRKDAWDDLLSEVYNSKEETSRHWQTCFYRKFDVTLERSRIFSCSRIAKKGWDDQGLLIDDGTTSEQVINYLSDDKPKEACYSCATINRESNIKVALQSSGNLERIAAKSIQYLNENNNK
ncbi:radical SAM protein [Vibrio parahaemolyticus]|uniref:radical SAM protein n=2 Tax=Vibrio parahaemolyticus TaxID=670 RepID=UPI000419FB91|nr:radical SAM protein [Vibrio parahaemolyticus]AMG09168.1 radical SAM protein [Vibrio parahaemolyticus]EGQ7775712.1 radical SAM protein [Vibrio parahaemolyticus]EGQ7838636.1 radical SAM protein [Vibrio parahaemolyticus]EGQ7866311.1 radical SAM protein [Vibrio parahaemolyticus]EGQ7884668.1 radical SAM protein [Vibrio parahaemolyticus]